MKARCIGENIPREIATCPYCDGTLYLDSVWGDSVDDISVWCRERDDAYDPGDDHLFMAEIYWPEVEYRVWLAYQQKMAERWMPPEWLRRHCRILLRAHQRRNPRQRRWMKDYRMRLQRRRCLPPTWDGYWETASGRRMKLWHKEMYYGADIRSKRGGKVGKNERSDRGVEARRR